MKRSFPIVAIVVGLALFLAISLGDVETDYVRHVRKAPWPDGLGSLNEVPSHLTPRVAPTPAALELIGLARPLGIDFRPRAPRPWADAAPFDAIKKPLSDYLDSQLARETDGIDAPPQPVMAYLAAHRAELDAVRAHLLTSPSIAWPVRLTNFAESPIPNLLGHLQLLEVLTADALAEARTGRRDAWDDLHAAWQLGAGLRSRPDEISQLIALSASRMINAAALRLPDAAPPWFSEVGAFDHRHAILAAKQVEAWSWLQTENPFQRYCGANAADHLRHEAEAMARSRECGVDGESRSRAAEASLPRWNVFGRIVFPTAWSVWSRTARFTAEREATERVMQLRRGESPSTQSRCSDGHWIVTPRRIAFSRDIEAKPATRYPLRYALP